MSSEAKQILSKLKDIQSELEYIRENMPDKELFLSTEEKKLLEQSYSDEKEGKFVSTKELRRRLNL